LANLSPIKARLEVRLQMQSGLFADLVLLALFPVVNQTMIFGWQLHRVMVGNSLTFDQAPNTLGLSLHLFSPAEFTG
jgi:hypothetical protein